MVTHVEFLRRSRCFNASGGQLGCLSCHDSHVHREPEARRDLYRTACLKCHEDKPCKVPVAERLRQNSRDRCTDCHMPRYAAVNIPHAASTDHSIPRRPSAPQNDQEEEPRGERRNTPLVPFYHPGPTARNPESTRCLAIALTSQLNKGAVPVQPWGEAVGQMLDTVIARDPEDREAWHAKAQVLKQQGRTVEALTTLKTFLAKGPPDELALFEAGCLAHQLNHLDTAATYARQAVEMNPGLVWYRTEYVSVLYQQHAWDEVLEQSREVLRVDPSRVQVRAARIAGQRYHDGARPAGVAALRPPYKLRKRTRSIPCVAARLR